MKRQIAKFTVLFCWALGASEAIGQGTIFSSFGPNDGFDAFSARGIAWNVDAFGSPANIAYGLAAEFNVGNQAYTLSSVTLALGNSLASLGTNNIAISIVADSGGKPTGSVLETLATHPSNIGDSPTPHLVTYNSSLHPVLSSGGAFWLVAQPVDYDVFTRNSNASFGWATGTSPGTFVLRYFDLGNVSWNDWQIFTTSDLPAFRVDGTAIPEPNASLLLLIAIMVIGVRRRHL